MRREATVILASTLLICACKPPPQKNREMAEAEQTPEKTGEVEQPPQQEGQIPAPEHVAAPPPDAIRTASGLAYKVLQPGQGDTRPGPTSTVMVHYTGWTTDGKMFDSSVLRNKPNVFPLDKVIPGWSEGVQLMVQGEKTRFWVPEELAYKGRPDRPQGMLVFDVELIGLM
jgi:peptidylprolyl isomerase